MKSGKKALVYFALTGVFALVGGGMTLMLFSSNSERASELKRLKAEAKKPEELQVELEEAKLSAQSSATELAHLEQNIPELAYVPTMLKELEQFGNESGVKVYGVRPFVAVHVSKKGKEKKRDEKPYSELSIEIKGKGRYQSVMKFVDAMKSFPKIVAVRTVSLSPKHATGDSVGYSVLDVTLELRAFLFKPAPGEDLGYPKVEIDLDQEKPPTNLGSPSNTGPQKPQDGKVIATLSQAKGGSL